MTSAHAFAPVNVAVSAGGSRGGATSVDHLGVQVDPPELVQQ